ncbi:hypothetical protein H310_01440 [Aphanomyces invadans]|uniref:Uncharacterized protein n=1 Tax=Aphanomyces invadans TaxID=157072 RepID=A0A024UST0_9STRA|nr:hypothetical protein H310_01440 [Aphanomyces invadans]ETW08962.1 hypothetical protein H310_01440 [Aphanomyces invadans]|eukprot:XP_008862767.1 hypothetical protein H310_01440 [Aphanomyces invadans]
MVVLQHDNARAHVTPMDTQLKAAFDEFVKKGWVFSLVPQPPISPDTNILDLGFFAAIQSLQQKKSARSVDELEKLARKGQLPQNVQSMERAVSAEVEEARCLDTLARELERSALSD